ncbi:MAG: hypothetical protein PHX44_04155 [Sulfurimonas sp.]|uniref:hypothetical protein n=1 Tax=Sulfurimonas sp. TaxID=2022749 RepID=UPI002605B2D4|nr:hypothetical protein [Sulfurimonas sp.]MDD2652225.1 hypothetical protein [Sulfurimonas sp.]MDD3450493.1 hypothetical protein [Sulfurimonas sp.]
MQTVTLQMSDSVAEHVMYFLRQLPKKEVKIVKSKPSTEEKIAKEFDESYQQMKRGETLSYDEFKASLK